MRLRTALNVYKRTRDGRFPEECPTAAGAFSGHGDRLVYVDPDGSLRDHSSPLSGLYGVDRSRFAIETGDGIAWFDELDTVRQHYYRETTLVETEYDAGAYTVHRYDLTLGRAHLTHVELRGAVPADAHLTAFLTFAPEGRETKVGHLVHDAAGPSGSDAVEVYHREEHDYVTASTGLDDVRGQVPERFEELMDPAALEFPRDAVIERYEDARLSGDVVVSAPLERQGRAMRTTLVTQLSDHGEIDRETALADLRGCAAEHGTASDLRDAARALSEVEIPDNTPRSRLVREDLRALSLLTAPTGARIAAPEFDPFYANSGGYGYTWFRDDAEISSFLLDAEASLSLDLTDRLRDSARFYCATQRPDGTWPHRVWAVDGSLAPGWANARVEERADSPEYQADQTASATAFLASLLRERDLPRELADRVTGAVRDAVDGLDDSLTDSGLPERCQNAWENMDGQFTHTAATFLRAYAAVARAPVDADLREQAADRAAEVFAGLDRLYDEERGVYALRRERNAEADDETGNGNENGTDAHLDARLDSSTLALVEAVGEYDRLGDERDEMRVETADLDRLADHVETTLDGLWRDSEGSPVAGLVRFEGDAWRTADQSDPKVWSVATGWGANAAARLAALLDDAGETDRAETLFERAGDLYRRLTDDGALTTDAGYLAEQVFDDGTHDSATPLGWSHAIRLHTTAFLRANDALPARAAPSGPEHTPRWTTGEKYGVGTVADHDADDPSKVWFTLTEGALTEARFPRVDLMNLRTLDFLIVDADEDATYTARTHNETRRDDATDTVERRTDIVEEDGLVFRQTVAERGDGRGHAWTLTAEYAIDPNHDAILTDVTFEADDDNEYAVYAVADTALTNTGVTDRALRLGEPGSYHLVARDASAYDAESEPLLVDENGDAYSVAVAMTAAGRFEWATVDVAGSDHLASLFDGETPTPNQRVDDESVVLAGRIGSGRRVATTVALGFAEHADTAAALGEAAGALARGYETVRSAYLDSWQGFLDDVDAAPPASVADDDDLRAQYKTSVMGLRAVEDKTFEGAGIASPSVPWGESVAAEESRGYGYNFVWARDIYQVFTAFVAAGHLDIARKALEYVYEYQQDENGFIPQNTYVDGRTRWGGEQMDNISFPQVMAYQLREAGVGFESAAYGYRNLRRSADYVAHNGPATAQERWEEEAGYSPSSIAAEVAGLTCAAAVAADRDETADALSWFALADDWSVRVEEWCATETGTERHDRTPYYVRVVRDGDPEVGHLRTLANGGPTLDEREILDAGFLELVRLGVKPADDPVIRNSVAEVDEHIRVPTPYGPGFYRYNGDSYGEQSRDDEGGPWGMDVTSQGRLWPILTGERGEYELRTRSDDAAAAGDADPESEDSPASLLRTMAGFANTARILPEQVWDQEYGTAYGWEFGKGTGAATPLAWSFAEFVRLAHGVDAGAPVETPAAVRERFAERDRPAGPSLRVDTDYEGDALRVAGESDGALVAVKRGEESTVVEPDADGGFETRLGLTPGENRVIVAAATHRDLDQAGTTVRRRTL